MSAAPRVCGTLDELRTPDGSWVNLELESPARREGVDGSGTIAAVIDTGLAIGHPTLDAAVIERVDLTGEGPGDECGHGTTVGLLLLQHAPGTKLIEVKALGRTGRSTPADLAAALRWVATRPDITAVNMSAGVFRPWCAGDCDVCEAANAASDAALIIAAAGNREGVTSCPAKAERVVGTTVVDELGALLPGVGIGDIGAPQPRARTAPIGAQPRPDRA